MQRNGVGVHDTIDDRRKQVFEAAVEQLRRALALKQNCQVVYNIGRDGSVKAKITLDIDLDIMERNG